MPNEEPEELKVPEGTRFADVAVFVVESGEYSGRNVVGVFSTRELAETYVMETKGLDSPEITPHALDDPGANTKDGAWRVRIDVRGVVHGAPEWDDGVRLPVPVERPKVLRRYYPAHVGQISFPPYFTGWGETPEHARRSAEEVRRAMVTETIVREPSSPAERDGYVA